MHFLTMEIYIEEEERNQYKREIDLVILEHTNLPGRGLVFDVGEIPHARSLH